MLQKGEHWDAEQPTAAHDLHRSDDGYWSGAAPGVARGDLYRYEITHADNVLQKLDPAARDVVHSGLTRHDPDNRNASIVVGREPYPWAPFTTPAFENYIIYQFHVSSFAGRNDHLDKDIATFSDIENKLSYIRELGFNAIQAQDRANWEAWALALALATRRQLPPHRINPLSGENYRQAKYEKKIEVGNFGSGKHDDNPLIIVPDLSGGG